jgi:serine phosphatase RsbU (regulator of sigma subunit)
MKKAKLLFGILVCLNTISFAQNTEVDSLLIVLNTTKNNTNKVNVLLKLAEINGLKYGKIENAIRYNTQALELSKQLQSDTLLYKSYTSIGIIYSVKGDYIKAIDNFNFAFHKAKLINSLAAEASCLSNIGTVYRNMGSLSKAFDYQLKSIKIKEKIGAKLELSKSYNNLSVILNQQENYKEALMYAFKAIKLKKELNLKEDLAASYNNLGQLYIDLNDYHKALSFSRKAEKLNSYYKNNLSLATSFSNIASCYMKLGKLDLSLEYNLKAIKIKEFAGIMQSLSTSYINIGEVYLLKNQNSKARLYFEKALTFSKKIGTVNLIADSYKSLGKLDSVQGNYKNALYNFHNWLIYQDSFMDVENSKKSLTLFYEYEFAKKQTADSISNSKEKLIQQTKINQQAAEIKSKRIQQYALFGGLSIVLIFSIALFNRFKITQKQKLVIEVQKNETEKQKLLVEDKNKEISDSIQYAKRIQEAILPSSNFFHATFEKGFIYFNPKDIVSGDFYWMEKVGASIYFAAADCTGHGVPGAMVSVVCANALSKALLEEKHKDTGKLLDRTRELVVEQFSKSEENVQDGMDISLCKITGNSLQWSGANNPLWIIRKDSTLVEEIKADKQPIGRTDKSAPFQTHSVQLNEGDSIYLFTDGYADQFGGEKGKKFMYKPLKDLLLSISGNSMNQQKELLDEQFLRWKGNLEQVDDVCVIGVRIG